jgi:hypothetical protein
MVGTTAVHRLKEQPVSHVRPRIYTSLTILITTLLMLAMGTATASAGPAPIVEPPGQYPPDSTGSSVDDGSWATSSIGVTMIVVAVVAVLALAAVGLNRRSHHHAAAAA